MNRKLKLWIAGAAVLVIGGAVIAIRLSPATSHPASASAAPPVKVAVATATQRSMPHLLSGIGELEATRQVMVTAEVNGLVTAIAFHPGESVKAGQTLVQLNDAPERGERARLEAQLTNARRQMERTRRLLPQQTATQEQLDQTQSDFQQASAGIARINALIEQKRIRAPFDGVLGVRKVNLGQYVQAGSAMVSLTDARTLYANITLPERSLAALKPGQDMAVNVDAYPDHRFNATVSTIEPRIDAGTRTVLVQASVANPNQLLTPGMFVNAAVTLPPRPGVISVPETAVSSSAYGDFAYVLQGADTQLSDTVRQIYVKTGERVEGRVELLDGVKAGERVVTSGQLRLRNGASVQVVSQDTVALDAANEPELGQ
jgi:multidrug efflux system membrane fusion protein